MKSHKKSWTISCKVCEIRNKEIEHKFIGNVKVIVNVKIIVNVKVAGNINVIDLLSNDLINQYLSAFEVWIKNS